MPHLKLLYLDPPPLLSYPNIFKTIIGQPYHDKQPDYLIHMDEETGQTQSFREVKKRANDLAAALASPMGQGELALRVEDGEIIGVMGNNSSDYVVLVLALLKIVVPFVPILHYSTPSELKHALKLTKAMRLFTTPQKLSKFLPVKQELNIAAKNVYTTNGKLSGYGSLDDLFDKTTRNGNPHKKPHMVPKDTPAFILFSSGTTSLPKAAMISHGNLLHAFRQNIIVVEDETFIPRPVMPAPTNGLFTELAFVLVNHIFGLHVYCIWAFMTPTCFIMFRK
ncbi:Very long-chain acyl-CoA synthetase [Leucoagaricus sp. SymC.cos]|nr:Very long-chain acyl-CoA synthetase [Leucoagaricus sp. SymC.cos]